MHTALSPLRWLVCGILLGSMALAQSSSIENARPVPPFDPEARLSSPTLAFFVLGDWGSGSKGQKQVARVMIDKYRKDGAEAVLGTGDNFYPQGVESTIDPLWSTRFETVYPSDQLPIPFWATLGNHDYGKNPDAQVAYSGIALPNGETTRWTMPARYWTTVFSRSPSLTVRVVGLDTQILIGADAEARARQLAWMDSVLDADQSTVVLVLGHHPMYSNGMHGNTVGLIRHLKPLLEKHAVDAYLAGHDHDIQILSAVNGVQYVVSGGGGLSRNVRYAANTVFAATNMGVVWMQVNPASLLFHVLDAEGTLINAVTLPLNPQRTSR